MAGHECWQYLEEVGEWGPLGAPQLQQPLLEQLASNKQERSVIYSNKNTSNDDTNNN